MLVTARSGANVRTFDPRTTGPESVNWLPLMPLLAAVVIVASAASVTVPEIDAVRLDVLNDPRIAPKVPLDAKPTPPI